MDTDTRRFLEKRSEVSLPDLFAGEIVRQDKHLFVGCEQDVDPLAVCRGRARGKAI